MNYSETIDYLFSRLPMFSRVGGRAIKTGLQNITLLCEALDNPHKKFKSIHIAGTNGKGSVSHMLAAILQTGGYITGLHTSPHLFDFRERIRINGEPVPEQFVIDFVQTIQPYIEDIEPSFFEISVAMAFSWFAHQRVDIAVIETGLGGRLDSTNIILPELSIITNIGMDHMQFLGNDLASIAKEKAGIIKSQTPVVIGESLPETQQVFLEVASEKKSEIFFAQQHYALAGYHWENGILQVEVAHHTEPDHLKIELDLTGIYQLKNLLTVLQACHVLQQNGWQTTFPVIKDALRSVRKLTGLHGRWEIIHTHPTVVLDVAHNEDGMRQVLQQVELFGAPELHIILGMVSDKEIDKVLSLLPIHANYYFTQANIPRALDKILLQEKAARLGLGGDVHDDVNKALKNALIHAGKKDLVLICGSIFLVSEVRRELIK